MNFFDENMDFKDIEVDLTTPQVKVKRRSSFFNIEGSSQKDSEAKNAEYEQKLKNEQISWVDFMHKIHSRVKQQAKKEKVPYDSSILSEERREYLDKEIDIGKYLQGHEEYMKRVSLYLTQKEWLRKRLEYCQDQLSDTVLDTTQTILR